MMTHVKNGVCLISGVGNVISFEIVLAAVIAFVVCIVRGFGVTDHCDGGVHDVSSGTTERAMCDLGRWR